MDVLVIVAGHFWVICYWKKSFRANYVISRGSLCDYSPTPERIQTKEVNKLLKENQVQFQTLFLVRLCLEHKDGIKIYHIIEEVAEDHQIARDNDGRDKAVDVEESRQAGEEGRIWHLTRSKVQRKKNFKPSEDLHQQILGINRSYTLGYTFFFFLPPLPFFSSIYYLLPILGCYKTKMLNIIKYTFW